MSSLTQSPGSVEQSTGLTFKYRERRGPHTTHNTILALICGNNGPGIVQRMANIYFELSYFTCGESVIATGLAANVT